MITLFISDGEEPLRTVIDYCKDSYISIVCRCFVELIRIIRFITQLFVFSATFTIRLLLTHGGSLTITVGKALSLDDLLYYLVYKQVKTLRLA